MAGRAARPAAPGRGGRGRPRDDPRRSRSPAPALRRPSAPGGPDRGRATIRRSASAATSSGATTKPVDPSETTSATPPTSVATTGRPEAAASMSARGVPSRSDVRAITSAAAYQSGVCRGPTGEDDPIAEAGSATRASRDARSAPSPTRYSRIAAPRGRRSRTRRSRRSSRLIRTSRPIAATTNASSGTPSRRRASRRASTERAGANRASVQTEWDDVDPVDGRRDPRLDAAPGAGARSTRRSHAVRRPS